METKWIFRIAGILFLAVTIIVGFSYFNETIDNDTLAKKLVTQCANIQENDIVLVSGGVLNLELLEDISTHIRKLGAFPLVTLNSDRQMRRYFDEVPTKYDSQFPKLSLKLATMIDAFIGISYNENQALLADVSPERFATINETNKVVNNIWFKRSIKNVSLGNNLYPTAHRAKLFNTSEEELAKVFWAGVNVDYQQLQKIGKKIKNVLASGKEIHITNPNGTNLKVKIESRPIYISDGVISEEDIKMGGAACQVWLPAGEVYLTPIPGTAEGKIIVDRDFYFGKEIQKLEITFNAGKLTSMKAKAGIEALKARYEAGGNEKDIFSFIDIGINPNVQIIKDSYMNAWMPSGMVTVGFGNNLWAGGNNESNFSNTCHLIGSTLKVDGKILVENGTLIF